MSDYGEWRGFPKSRLAPSDDELNYIYAWLSDERIRRDGFADCWEFGCGCTTFAIRNSVNPSNYFISENYGPCIVDTINHCWGTDDWINFLPSWKAIKKWGNWGPSLDLVFVDSSVGNPHGDKGYWRDECIQAAEPYMADGCIVILHDFCKRAGRKPRAYLEANGYKLVDVYEKENGWGIWKKC